MPGIYLHDPEEAPTSARDLPNGTLVISSPVALTKLYSFQDLLNWLKSNPEILSMLLMALLVLLGAATPTEETPTK